MTIRGHRTSISIEDPFWTRLQGIARLRGCPLAVLVAGIDAERGTATNLSSAIRLFVLDEALSNCPERSGIGDRDGSAAPSIDDR